MEPAVAGQTLSSLVRGLLPGGRPRAALLLFLGLGLLAGCRTGGAPRIAEHWRVGLGARGMSLDDGGRRLAVVCRRSNDVWVLSLPDGALEARVDTLPRPRAVLLRPDGDGFYVAEGLSNVALVGMADQRVERSFRPYLPIGSFAFEPTTRRLFCAQVGLPTLGVYRPSDMHLETSLDVGGEVQAVAFDGADGWVVTRQADALVRVSLKEMNVQTGALAGPDPRGLALDLDSGLAYVPCHGRAGAVSALALPSPAVEAASVSPDADNADAAAAGALPAPAGRSRNTQAALDAQEDAVIPAAAAFHRYDGSGVAVLRLRDVRRVDYIDVPGGPVAAVLAPSRRLLAVACEDGMLRLVDLRGRRVAAALDLEGRPGAMLPDPDGLSLLVALSSAKVVERVLPGAGWR